MIPKNGIYIIQGELNHVVAALRRNNRWSGGHFHHDQEQDPLLNSFSQLKQTLQNTSDINDLDSNIFLGPFLEVIRSEDTTGPITGIALSSINKFLSYGIIDPSCESASTGIDNLADAVTHARFVGTDPSSDEVVLMQILQVLRTLLLSPVGIHMTNESVCEIMQSCFRICFEMRLSELLRRTAEKTLIDMVQLLFLRLPQFKEDLKENLYAPHIRKMFKRSGPLASTRRGSKKAKNKLGKQRTPTLPRKEITSKQEATAVLLSQTNGADEKNTSFSDNEEVTAIKNILDKVEITTRDGIDVNQQKVQQMIPLSEIDEQTTDDSCNNELGKVDPEKMKSIDSDLNTIGVSEIEKGASEIDGQAVSKSSNDRLSLPLSENSAISENEADDQKENLLESFQDHGVISLHFPDEDARSIDSLDIDSTMDKIEDSPTSPDNDNNMTFDQNNEYVNPQGVRFTVVESAKEGHGPLVPYGLPCVRELLRFLTTLINPHDRHNTNTMIHIGLSLLTVALESDAAHIGHFATLMQLVKDDMCKNIFQILQCDIHILFALSMRVSFLLFEALRGSLRYQFEKFFCKLMEILSLENLNVPYEKREMALEYINQMFHIPCLVQEVYVNFDCDFHASNMLEDIGKTLSKNAFRPGNLSSVNLLALDSLLTIVNEIELHCNLSKKTGSDTSCITNKSEKERTASSSSEVTEYESGCDDIEHDINNTALSTSGYAVGKRLLGLSGMSHEKLNNLKKVQIIENTNESVTPAAPSLEEIVLQKRKKKLLNQGIDEFNKKPRKGIEFLQEHGLLTTPFVPDELIHYLKENPRVDKKVIGDYIGDRKNEKSLAAFVKSFELVNVRLDEALRSFLETFRLPGESPVIAHILENFTSAYFEGNPTPYKNTDAAFTLAYAVIMLNVDQHNKNVKQQKSMTVEEYKRNLRQTNDGEDFPPKLLEEIYDNIKNNEIVMPSERVGKVKEMYEWKVLIRKSANLTIPYTHVNSSLYDEELFLVIWGPTVAALSYIYDNSNDKETIQKAILGFRKLASISAHYNLSEVFDNLLISLCKFTSLLVTGEGSDNLPVLFGSNMKSQLSARTVFSLAHKQGDILREGWQNLLVCILQLFNGKLLPPVLTEVEDFVDPSGKITLIKEEPQSSAKQDNTGVFAAFYSYMIANPDTTSKSNLSTEEKQAQDAALNCIKDCHPEHIITESKFLRPDSLQELIKALIIASKPEHSYESTDVPYDEDAAVFCLELLIKIALQNRDRISLLWQSLREHISNIIISAPKVSFLVERAVVGLLRLSIRLIRRDDISAQVLITLRILLMMHPRVLLSCSKQISYGLHELIRTNASNIHYSRDWITILTLLQVVGAGASPPIVKPGPCLTLISGDLYSISQENVDMEGEENHEEESKSEKERDNENEEGSPRAPNGSNSGESGGGGGGEQWLLINKNLDEDLPINQFDLAFKEKLNKHDSKVFIKASSSIGFIVRDIVHVKDFNVFQCIYATLLFGEAAANGGLKHRLKETDNVAAETRTVNSTTKKMKKKRAVSPTTDNRKRASLVDSPRSEDEVEINESTSNIYDAISLQLLDLMYVLHSNSKCILGNMTWETFSDHQKVELKARWSSKDSIDQLPSTFRGDIDSEMTLLWVKCWCPLLQGIARFCCDIRRDIRMSALTILQRSLLTEDLQAMNATEWENCFNQVLFPMLASLLEISADVDPIGLEETRMRAATLLCKAFLQHLNTLISLATFTALWMTILDFMDKYMHADNSDLLYEAIPESLKNMLLVMSTAGIFEHQVDATDNITIATQTQQSDYRRYSALWQVTWDRIDCFLPKLKSDLMATQSPVSLRATSPPEPDAPGVMTIHTEEEIAVKSQPSIEKVDGLSINNKQGNETEHRNITNLTPVISSAVVDSVPSSTCPLPPAQVSSSVTAVPSVAQRASSPLLSDLPPSLNITLHTPLPHLSPPGSAHAIHDQLSYPIPLLLPPMASLANVQSDTVETATSSSNTSVKSDNTSVKHDVAQQEPIVVRAIHDI